MHELLKKFIEYPVVSTDSRNILENSIYFALKGERFDGNQFAKEALSKGARIAIVDDSSIVGPGIIYVANVLESMQQLAMLYRKLFNFSFIAITGSNGKTTTKELVYSVLSQKFNVLCTKGNLNNHIGVPLTLFNLRDSHQIAIIEMGANHVGEIANLCLIAQPDYGLITNIGKAHIGEFGGYDNIIKAKTELYDYISLQGKAIFINSEDALLNEHANKRDLVKTSYGENSSISASILSNNENLIIELKCMGEKRIVETHLYGSYNLPNVLAAASIGIAYRLTIDDVKKGIELYIPDNSRSEIRNTAKNKLLLDMYNANPSSMNVALNEFLLKKEEGYRKMCILGDMYELGEESLPEHSKLIKLLKENKVEVITVGKNFIAADTSNQIYLKFEDVDACKIYLKQNTPENYFILLKGSRGVKLERLLEVL